MPERTPTHQRSVCALTVLGGGKLELADADQSPIAGLPAHDSHGDRDSREGHEAIATIGPMIEYAIFSELIRLATFQDDVAVQCVDPAMLRGMADQWFTT